MANVNQAVKLLEYMMVYGVSGDELDEFLSIDDTNRPIIYRKLNNERATKLLTKQRDEFLEIVNKLDTTNTNPKLSIGDSDNSNGADALYGDYDIEMKFGFDTNANIGNGAFVDIFPLAEGLFEYFDLEQRKARREMYAKNGTELEEIYAHNLDAYENIATTFNKAHDKLSGEQVSKINRLINKSGSSLVDNDNKFIKIVFTKEGASVVESTGDHYSYNVEATVSDNGDRSRLTFYVENDDVVIRFVYNCKNTVRFTDSNGNKVKFPAKTMLGSPAFNVFVSVKK